ncbi:MAG: nuclear transport factor 2 family protein [Gemmatimonadota bacterium]
MKSPMLQVASALLFAALPLTAQQSPQSAANELLAADRAFSAAASTSDLVAALDALFADDVVMPLPQGKWARGREAARDALRADPESAGAKVDWEPVRAGVVADALHGYTYGFMKTRRGEQPAQAGKYLAYWVKGPLGWRVAAYKHSPRVQGDVARTMMPPSLPPRMVKSVADASIVQRHRASLVAAEQAFSDLANSRGLGNAFQANGAKDAINMGGNSADFIFGNVSIARFVSGAGAMDATPFTWSADDALVASSGDLGITFGQIHQNGAPSDAPSFAFFTIWRRESPTSPWKYVAE